MQMQPVVADVVVSMFPSLGYNHDLCWNGWADQIAEMAELIKVLFGTWTDWTRVDPRKHVLGVEASSSQLYSIENIWLADDILNIIFGKWQPFSVSAGATCSRFLHWWWCWCCESRFERRCLMCFLSVKPWLVHDGWSPPASVHCRHPLHWAAAAEFIQWRYSSVQGRAWGCSWTVLLLSLRISPQACQGQASRRPYCHSGTWTLIPLC